ncbi:MAG TPA: S1C family serine protease, partial [Steroidobacteraceae bacterium]|nr:S1C family serine protease [Steroidobacteraceae bacterium]
TSETPEEQDGAWQWLRFSAPASPGNSGGPLLDASGRVIGVIARKSANENLNYALPIALVLNAPENMASIDMRMTAGVAFLTARKTVRVKVDFDLPLQFAEFDRRLIALNDEQFDVARRQLLEESADGIFPRGNSSRLLADPFLTANPAIISQQADGSWDVPRSNAGGNTQLGNDGYIWMGAQSGAAMFRIRYPGELDVASSRGDSKLLSEQLLRGIRLGRSFGAENVRITSLGDAGKPREFKDDFGRTWQQWFYPMPFADSTMVVSALPTPEGYIGIWRSAGGAGVERTAMEARLLANFAQISYSGSLPQWRSFLADTQLRPESFGKWKTALDPTGEISLGFPRFALQLDQQVLKLTDDSQLNVFPGTIMDGDTPAWDVLAIQFNLESRRSQGIGAQRRAKPAADAGQVPNNRWDDMKGERAPFNGYPVRNQGGGVGRKVVGAEGKALADAGFLYELSYVATSQVQGEIQRAVPQLLEMFRIIED